MRWDVVHELPGRIRLHLSVRRRSAIDRKKVEAHFQGLSGIQKVSFNGRTRNLLVEYDGGRSTKEAIFSCIRRMPRDFPARPRDDRVVWQRKKRAALWSGFLLLLSPLMPLFLRRIVALAGAWPIIQNGLRALRQGRLNIDVLDASATGVALGMADYRAAAVISFLLKLGEAIEEWTQEESRRSISEMLRPEEELAWVEADGVEKVVPVADLAEGDVVIARMGHYIPVDGIVIEGEASVNQSSMTGESMPVAKEPGAMVYAGTAVEEGRIRIRTLRVGDETRVARIVAMILASETLKAEVQSHAERLADRLVPYTFALSLLTYAATRNPYRAAAALEVDYSCSARISAPLSIMAAMVTAAKQGVLIKGGKSLEKMAKADAFLFDKTGTLTTATPRVAEVVSFGEPTPEEVLRQAACVEEHFPHPLAVAIGRAAAERGLLHPGEEHQDPEYIPVHGISSRIGRNRILVGSRHFVTEHEGIDVSAAEPHLDRFSRDGRSVLYVAIGDRLAGVIAIEDPLRESSAELIRRLRDAGVGKIVMLTGDGEPAARTVAQRLGIEETHAQVFPDRKLEIIDALKAEGHTVVMVGDGINDSPALSRADVGVAMGRGADITKEAANVVLLDDDLVKIAEVKRLSEETIGLIGRNFRYIVGINSVVLALGLSGVLPPVLAAAAHNLTTIGGALNSVKRLWRNRSRRDGLSSTEKSRDGRRAMRERDDGSPSHKP